MNVFIKEAKEKLNKTKKTENIFLQEAKQGVRTDWDKLKQELLLAEKSLIPTNPPFSQADFGGFRQVERNSAPVSPQSKAQPLPQNFMFKQPTEVDKLMDMSSKPVDTRMPEFKPYSSVESQMKSPLQGKYNINIETFDKKDFEKWAKENGFVQMDVGIWGRNERVKSTATMGEMYKLQALANQNERRKGGTAAGALGSTFMSGAFQGLPSPIMRAADKLEKNDYEQYGLHELVQPYGYISPSEGITKEQAAHPIAAMGGNITGGIAGITLMQGLVNEGLKKIPTFNALPFKTQQTISRMATFAGTGAVSTALRTDWSEGVAEGVGNVIQNTVTGGMAAYFGGKMSAAVGNQILAKLADSKLSSRAVKTLTSVGAALAYAVASTTYREGTKLANSIRNKEEYKPDIAGIATDIITTVLWAALQSYVGNFNETAPYRFYQNAENYKYFTKDDLKDMPSLKAKYKELAFKNHPDQGGSNAAMAEINQEYTAAKKVIVGNAAVEMQKEAAKGEVKASTVENAVIAYNEVVDDITPVTQTPLAQSETGVKTQPVTTPSTELGEVMQSLEPVKTGDTFIEKKSGNKIIVVEADDKRAKVEIDNGKNVTSKEMPQLKAMELHDDERFEPVSVQSDVVRETIDVVAKTKPEADLSFLSDRALASAFDLYFRFHNDIPLNLLYLTDAEIEKIDKMGLIKEANYIDDNGEILSTYKAVDGEALLNERDRRAKEETTEPWVNEEAIQARKARLAAEKVREQPAKPVKVEADVTPTPKAERVNILEPVKGVLEFKPHDNGKFLVRISGDNIYVYPTAEITQGALRNIYSPYFNIGEGADYTPAHIRRNTASGKYEVLEKGSSVNSNAITDKYIGKEYSDGEKTYKVAKRLLHGKEPVYLFEELKPDGSTKSFGAQIIRPDEIKQHINLLEKQKNNYLKWQEADRVAKEKQAAEQAQKDEEEKLMNGFLKPLTALEQGRHRKTLSVVKNYGEGYGAVTLREFVEKSVADNKGFKEVKTLKNKYSDIKTPREYIASIDTPREQFDVHKMYRENNLEKIKQEHPFLYYKMTDDNSMLDDSYYNKEYRVFHDDNVFTKIPKTAYDYAMYLSNKELTDDGMDDKIGLEDRGNIYVTEETEDVEDANPTVEISLTKEQSAAKEIGAKLGVEVEYEDLPDGINGYYKEGKIIISFKTKQPAKQVLLHGLTHHLEQTKEYDSLKKAVSDYIDNAGYEVDSMVEGIKADYVKKGITLTKERAEKEIVSKFVESKLFDSLDDIEQLVKDDRNLAQAILDWIKETLIKLKGTAEEKILLRARKLFESALKQEIETDDDVRFSLDTDMIRHANSASFSDMGDIINREYIANIEQIDNMNLSLSEKKTAKERIKKLAEEQLILQAKAVNPYVSGPARFDKQKVSASVDLVSKKNAEIISHMKELRERSYKNDKTDRDNAFSKALKNAEEKGEQEFTFEGKTYYKLRKNWTTKKPSSTTNRNGAHAEGKSHNGLGEVEEVQPEADDVRFSLDTPVEEKLKSARIELEKLEDQDIFQLLKDGNMAAVYQRNADIARLKRKIYNLEHPRTDAQKRLQKARQKTKSELDNAYFSAIEDGDLKAADKMVEDYARKNGYVPNNDYRIDHGAPTNDGYNAPIHNLTRIYPDDIYSNEAIKYYGDGESYDYESMAALKSVRDNPEKRIPIYRAVPSDSKESTIRNGDWVSVSRRYAEEHGKSNLNGYKIISNKVPAKHIFTDGNSISEQGYDNGLSMAYADTLNNAKLFDTIVYDNDGNIIPLSKRFNKRKADIRYSLEEKVSNLFKADEKAAESFSKQVDEWLKGEMKSDEHFKLGNTPAVLKALGAKKLPLIMTQDVIVKITGGKHNISLGEIKQLPQQIADPIMMFASDTVPGAYIVLTELQNKQGNDVIVAIHLNKYEKHYKVNRLASAYGKDNIGRFIEAQSVKGNLKYIDDKKNQVWSQSRGLQLPKLADTILVNNNILHKEDIVNSYYMQNPEKISLESEDVKNGRDILLHGNLRRHDGEGAGKQAKAVDGGTREARVSGKTRETSQNARRVYAKDVKDNGRTEVRRVGNGQVEAIKKGAFNDEMRSIDAENKERGIKETVFFVGEGKIAFSNKIFKGMIADGIVAIRYDHRTSTPQQINKHEIAHSEYNTDRLQKVKNIIKNSLPVVERRNIVYEMYKKYLDIYKGNEAKVFEEFVCDVLSGLNSYSVDFDKIANDYWAGNEIVDHYNPADYAGLIDAGGFVDNVERYSLQDQTETEAFKKWFGDSKVVDKDGKPLVVYHGSDNWINIFDKEKIGSGQGVALGEGFYFTKNENVAYSYGNRVTEAFLKLEKPYIFGKSSLPKADILFERYFKDRWGDDKQAAINYINSKLKSDMGSLDLIKHIAQEQQKTVAEIFKELGFDGIIDGHEIVVFEPNQIKSATDNIGTFDPNNPDIRYSLDNDIDELTPERIKEIKDQFEKDRVGVIKPAQKDVWGERWRWIAHNATRVFPDIPERGEKGTFFAEFRKMMVQWRNLHATSQFMTQYNLNEMVKDLSKPEFKTFSELVYFLDLQEEAKIQEERGYNEIFLPNEIQPAEVDAILAELEKEATPAVKKALEKRRKIWNELKEKYVTLNGLIGFNTENRFMRENYYRHQVIEHMTKKQGEYRGGKGMEISAGRGWLKQRHGSTKAINTDFLAVEYKAMLQMQYDTYIANTWAKIAEQYDIKPKLEREAFEHNKSKLLEIIMNEAAKGNPDGQPVMIKKNGKLVPKSETYEQQQWYNKRIMLGFNGLFTLAKDGDLPDFGGAYNNVVNALFEGNLNAVPQSVLYKYIGELANYQLDENSTPAEEQAAISARTVLKYTSQKKAWIKGLIGDDYQTWETMMKHHEGYEVAQPRRGNYFYTKEVIAEDVFNNVVNEMVLNLVDGTAPGMTEDMKKLFAQHADTIRQIGAAYRQMVLPAEIIKTMEMVGNPKQLSEGAKAMRGLLTAWKGWATTLNPLRTVKFGIRNFGGDIEPVLTAKPQILKYTKQAVAEIYDAMRHQKYSPAFLEWTERGGYSSMIFANEMDREMQDKLFKHLKGKQGRSILNLPANIIDGYLNGVEWAHNFREAILRYAAYLHFRNELNKTGGVVTDNVASNRFIVRGLKSVEDKAYQLSKDLLGAYDEINKLGQILRQFFVPFFSFTESNFKRYTRMIENVLVSDDSIGKKSAKLILRTLTLNIVGMLALLWSRIFKKEDDDKLPPSVRVRPHITLGSIDDNVYAFTRLGAFSEILEWFGLDDYKWDKGDIWEPLNQAFGMITPFLKLPIELTTGLNFYPEVTKPRAIRDKWNHFFNSWGVSQIYNKVTGKPSRGWGDIIENAFLYKYDYKESAYFEMQDRKREFQKQKDTAIYRPDAKSNALYYMKLAIRYGDKKTALKYLDKYFENGGTGKGINQSFTMLNPMYGFTGKDTMEKGEQFVKSLTDNEKDKLKIAIDYYENELKLPVTVTELLKKKDITNEQAKNVLKKYINSKM